MDERNACSCFSPTWKPISHMIATKVSWTTSWVPMHSLPWTQCKRWIPIESMGCVHMHWRIPTIERWGSPSHVRSDVENNAENNQKSRKISWVVSQMLAFGLKYDKIWTPWASNILLESMPERVWWCRHSKMESWSWTIYCSINSSNKERHVRIGGNRRSHVILRCCWKGKVLLSIQAKDSRRKGRWSTINLKTMIKATTAQLFK